MLEDQLVLSKSIKIINSKKKLSKAMIEHFFKKATEGKKRGYIDKKIIEKSSISKNINYSYCIFKVETAPAFLESSRFVEIKFGYCLLIEYKNYIIFNSKYCNLGKNTLNLIGTSINYEEFSNMLVNEDSEFQKLMMKNASIADSSVVGRTIEGNELNKSYSPTYSSSSIINSYKVRNDNGLFSVTLNSGRLTNIDKKVDLDNFIFWVVDLVNYIDSNTGKSSYLRNFGIPMKYENEIQNLVPKGILFDINNLSENVEFYCIDESGNKVRIDTLKVLQKYSRSFELEFSSKRKYKSLKNIEIRTLKKHIKLIWEDSCYVYYEDSEGIERSLYEYLSEHFLIVFDKINYSYRDGTLYFDNQLIDSESRFLDYFETCRALENAKSEKGDKAIGMTDTKFDKNCIFNIIEEEYSNSFEYMFCDDLGNEYADYIACDKDSIVFIHAKSSKSKFSASDFQVVIGQALKNIVYLNNVENMILDDLDNPDNKKTKYESWTGKYSNSDIYMLRKPLKTNDALVKAEVVKGIETLRKASRNLHARKSIYIVVNFISKKRLKSELQKGNNTQLKQMVWLLSSFIGTCTENGIQPKFICKE